jgi:hypothetical protein
MFLLCACDTITEPLTSNAAIQTFHEICLMKMYQMYSDGTEHELSICENFIRPLVVSVSAYTLYLSFYPIVLIFEITLSVMPETQQASQSQRYLLLVSSFFPNILTG